NKESLNLVVKKNTEDIVRILISEGFHKLKFCENKKPMQIGNGFTKMLDRTWEIHVRLIEMKEGLVAIQGEIEISRRYIQHIVSNRAPAIYEIANILKKNGIDYNIWNSKINDYVSSILDNHHIKLKGIPFLIPWIPACIIGPSVGLWFLLRFLGLFQ
ncbi:MAG: hypothetical protein QXW73_09665, partial [Nitrososphaerales archaeon]